MPLVQADAKGLEVVGVAFLSQDQVLIKEILDGVDQHSDNQEKFGLPSRLLAKIFVFRLIYGGTAYSYANDPEFTPVSSDPEFWQGVIEAFYEKYRGIRDWHTSLLRQVAESGTYTSPTGRQFTFTLNQWGKLPETTIKNYPVQSLGADIMTLVRVSLFSRMKKANMRSKLINTIHDSVVADCPDDEVDMFKKLVEQVFADIPANFERVFKVPFNLVQRVEFK